MAKNPFSKAEWKAIRDMLEARPQDFGLPARQKDSILLGSFNIRKLGAVKERDAETWDFLAHVCRRFDLLAVQEVMNNLEGLRHLVKLMGPEFGFVTSDVTGAFPGDSGLEERLAFIFNWKVVSRTDVASDVTYDRTKVVDILARRSLDFHNLLHPYGQALLQYEKDLEAYRKDKTRKRPEKPSAGSLPTFLTFIRTPFQVGFEVPVKKGSTAKPYRFVAIIAHLNFGEPEDRRQDFEAVMNWLDGHVHDEHAHSPDCILLGDLNLDFDNPKVDRPKIEAFLKTYDQEAEKGVRVNFPFLDARAPSTEPMRSNARLDETFDQIGLFTRDRRFPDHSANASMPASKAGPDYGVFDFCQLFAHATRGKPYSPKWTKAEKAAFFERFEHDVSDHMPIWLRLPRPETAAP